MLKNLYSDIINFAEPERIKVLQSFFKTGKGQYAEGDIFIGLTVPSSRKIAKKYFNLSFPEIEKLLSSKIHEERLIALLILVYNFQKFEEKRKEIYSFYIKNKKFVNNWDLVDLSSDKIVGAYLIDKSKSILYKLAKSKNLWDRRIAIVSTFYFIKHNKFEDTFKLANILMFDREDLIQKATGWMLREAGKRNKFVLVNYLKENYKRMPRTMLRYSIEKFEKKIRKKYLNNQI